VKARAGRPPGAARATLRRRERWLLGLALLALAICFARPGMTIERELYEAVVVFDVTQSMNVPDRQLDGKPASRLAFAKQRMRDSLLLLPCGSKLGWAVFTEYRSFLLVSPVEVCENLAELRSTLDRIDGRMAWTGGSEVAKGLYSGIAIAAQLPSRPALVFVSDGHEAPPLNPRHRPAFDGKPGAVKGLIVGVGDEVLSPIPKVDPLGRPLGFWRADEVLQTDPRSQGRGGSVDGERMVEDDGARVEALPGATPGSEHLSALREPYLALLAEETGLGYHRLTRLDAFADALTGPRLARPVPARVDLRPALAALALLSLLGLYLGGVLPGRSTSKNSGSTMRFGQRKQPARSPS